MSVNKVNFHTFAEFFLAAGCENALYLDGFVSEMYLPEKDLQRTRGAFGMIIGVTVMKNLTGQFKSMSGILVD